MVRIRFIIFKLVGILSYSNMSSIGTGWCLYHRRWWGDRGCDNRWRETISSIKWTHIPCDARCGRCRAHHFRLHDWNHWGNIYCNFVFGFTYCLCLQYLSLQTSWCNVGDRDTESCFVENTGASQCENTEIGGYLGRQPCCCEGRDRGPDTRSTPDDHTKHSGLRWYEAVDHRKRQVPWMLYNLYTYPNRRPQQAKRRKRYDPMVPIPVKFERRMEDWLGVPIGPKDVAWRKCVLAMKGKDWWVRLLQSNEFMDEDVTNRYTLTCTPYITIYWNVV